MKLFLGSILFVLGMSSSAFASINSDCVTRLMDQQGITEEVAGASCFHAQVDPNCVDKKALEGYPDEAAVEMCRREIPESNFSVTKEEHAKDLRAWDAVSISALAIALTAAEVTAGSEGWTVGQKFSTDKMEHFAGNAAIVIATDALTRRADFGIAAAIIASGVREVYKNLHQGMHCEIMSALYDTLGITLGHFLGKSLIVHLDEHSRPVIEINGKF